MAFPTFRQTVKNELLNFYNLLFIVVAAFIYYSISVLLINYRLLEITLFNSGPLFYKFNIIYNLVVGSYFALGNLDFILVVIASILVAVNLLMLIKTLKSLKADTHGKLTITVGGSTVLGILVAGSCACGFSILSLLGLGGALSFLPLAGVAVHLLIIVLLAFSLLYSLRTYHKEIVCKIK